MPHQKARSCRRSRALRCLSTKETNRSSTEGSTSCTQRTSSPAAAQALDVAASGRARGPPTTRRSRRPDAAPPRSRPSRPARRRPRRLRRLHLDDRLAEGVGLDGGGRALGDEPALVDEARACRRARPRPCSAWSPGSWCPRRRGGGSAPRRCAATPGRRPRWARRGRSAAARARARRPAPGAGGSRPRACPRAAARGRPGRRAGSSGRCAAACTGRGTM